ncbi:Cysteine-rich receptor-like protein kinase 29 [Morella rubra]|uniref:Cysteine-rich receptor-like protein kinase 29 n=1 Tax=Morella rubra TaxID=262757 RepID=A0A6A1WCL2_9ROSI|nr:Cysteine-rich receptor-like protein kinase 29 [Morella rubra]
MRLDSSNLVFFFSYAIFVLLVKPTIAQRDPYVLHRCSAGSNVASNSTYRANVNSLLSSLSSHNQIDNGFYNFSAGENPNKVNGIALCRGDLSPADCRSCVNMTAFELLFLCPIQKEGIMWYMNCTVRFSNNSIFGVMESEPMRSLYAAANVTDVSGTFDQVLETLLNRLRSEAAAGGSIRKLATGNATSTYFDIYALLQCTPDLDEKECSDCLNQSIRYVPSCCDQALGVRVLTPSCNLRYENNRFYNTIPDALPPSPSLPPAAEGNGSTNSSVTIVVIVVAVVLSVVIFFSIYTCIYVRKRKQRKKAESVDELISAESLQFDFRTIRAATDDFSDANKLGQGGFGAVYKGSLPNGQQVAVKRLSKSSGQGDLEFKNEILLVARLQHRNLVRLFGFCLEGNERLLIYELVSNSSLDQFLFDPIKRSCLDWERRYRIIVGIARGLLYLHEDSRFRIIHRDLKASNILLDPEMNPKISDFGLARLFLIDQTQDKTRRIVGTYGYMAPEYAMHGHFSVKSDVFSYGVLVLEIVCGQKNCYFRAGENMEDLLSYAWKNWREGTASSMIDPALRASSTAEIMRCIHIGLLCVQENAADRPTMASVILMLNSDSMALSVPSRPAFFMDSIVESDTSLDRSFQASTNEASITELYPR